MPCASLARAHSILSHRQQGDNSFKCHLNVGCEGRWVRFDDLRFTMVTVIPPYKVLECWSNVWDSEGHREYLVNLSTRVPKPYSFLAWSPLSSFQGWRIGGDS